MGKAKGERFESVTAATRKRAKAEFLAALAETGSVLDAAARAGASRQSFYRWQEQDAAFREAWERALRQSADVLEDRLRKRAEAGQSDIGAIFLLKSLRPERFRDYQPPQVHVTINLAQRVERARDRLGAMRNVTPRPALAAPEE